MEKNDSFKIMKNTKELVVEVVEFSHNSLTFLSIVLPVL